MKPSLQVRLSQHLALTPQLQQSIRLLQLSTLELHQEVEQMLDDYLRTDLWDFLARTDHRVGLVRAGRSERWGAEDDARPIGPNVSRHLLPEAGHWIHVDAPDAVFALISA